jgi:hypothetical protein
MSRKNALRALKNLCTFIGAIVLFSYFYNWTVDVRHWYVTLASAFMCSVLWLGFCQLHDARHQADTICTNLRQPSGLPPLASAVRLISCRIVFLSYGSQNE